MDLMQLTKECARWLEALRQEAEEARREAARLNDGTRAPSDHELRALWELYRSASDGLLYRYGPTAQYYLSQGVDLLHNALQVELRDFEAALSVLGQLEAQRRRHEAERWAIVRDTESYVARVRSEAHAQDLRRNEEHNRRWAAAFNYRPLACCAFCARPPGMCFCGFGWR